MCGGQSVTDIRTLVDDRLTACWFAYPVQAGWDGTQEIELLRDLGPAAVREANAVALLDSLAATRLLDSHVIVSNHAVASRRASFLTIVTHTRPDEVDNVTVSTPDVSLSGRGLAEATLPRFYGITVTAWSDARLPVDASTALLTEGAEALIPVDSEEHYQEDLGRAWFLLTDTPYVSHVCVAPRSELTRNPAGVISAVKRLDAARAAASDNARELRRNLSRDLEIERDLFTDTLADQTYTLGDAERAGLLGFWQSVGVTAPADASSTFVTLT
jgi:predicted solute-binding protein